MAETLLHIDASPRIQRSRSRPVADAYIAGLLALHDDIRIDRLDLWDTSLPSLEGGMIEGRYALINGGEVDPSIERAWAEIKSYTDRFLSYDGYIISTPMWNLGIPYPLKHYIDVVTQPGMLFSNDSAGNVVGLAAGKRAMVIAASAMDIEPGGPLAHLDFQMAYLLNWLGFIGITDAQTIRVAPTYGSEDVVAEAMNAAIVQATEFAGRF